MYRWVVAYIHIYIYIYIDVYVYIDMDIGLYSAFRTSAPSNGESNSNHMEDEMETVIIVMFIGLSRNEGLGSSCNM